ncbi:hypothetical protein HAX54_025584 [Datura stramonium]|uniref:ATP synthase subunit epsilon, mitochondrial n=1 Tax=Datura stramonium TaxID=4076 RepID=A0ABS8S6E6_DATST|nr:hypothetical protein [Datura stramonium]
MASQLRPWRSSGMTYITYSNLCANLVRNCLKEPYKSEALTREKVHHSIGKWVDGKPQKPRLGHYFLAEDFSTNFTMGSWNANKDFELLFWLNSAFSEEIVIRFPGTKLVNKGQPAHTRAGTVEVAVDKSPPLISGNE